MLRLAGGRAVLLTFAALALAAGAAAQEPPAAAVEASLARVTGTFSPEDEQFAGQAGAAQYANTGFFVSSDGLLLTSLSGIAGMQEITLLCPDGRQGGAHVVAVDQAADLALLKTSLAETAPLAPAEAASQPGDELSLLYAGHSGGACRLEPLRGSMTADREDLRLRGFRWHELPRIAMAADVPEGAAGAPFVDGRGRLVGVALAVRRSSATAGQAGASCSAYLLPADRLAGLLERMRGGESRRLGWLGLSVVEEPGDLEGIRVAAVLGRSPAFQAGIMPGDVLLQVDEYPLRNLDAYSEHVVEAGPRAGAELRILRGGNVVVRRVDIQPRPFLISSAPRTQPAR